MDDGVSRLMRHIGRHYVQTFNFKYARTGPLFEGTFKSTLVQSADYLMQCVRYIELNPVRAGTTIDPGNYVWSSNRSHVFGKELSYGLLTRNTWREVIPKETALPNIDYL
jgi:putative transposase